MGLAVDYFNQTRLATRLLSEPIPEIGSAGATPLSDMDDVHFGMNSHSFDGEMDTRNQAEVDLLGLGPRILDIKNRGGRTAEDTWRLIVPGAPKPRAYRGTRGATPGFQAYFDTFNQGKAITKPNYPAGAKQSGADVGGDAKYAVGATNKSECGGLQYGTRWSKTALEHALAHGGGHIHFHLDGMGDLSRIFDKSGDYAYNVTARELRYVWRNWGRFRGKVRFYNGYTAGKRAVMVDPPWKGLPPKWQPDSAAAQCNICHQNFTFTRRRHHCRMCGLVVCDNCSKRTMRLYFHHVLPAHPPGAALEKGAVRVCDVCYAAYPRLA